MAIIIETCPKCGHDLHDVMLASNPSIPKKECFSCGWSLEGEREEIIRVPFGGNTINTTETRLLNDYLNYSYQNSLNNLIVDDLVDDLNKFFQKGGEFGTGTRLIGSVYDECINQGFYYDNRRNFV